MANVTKRFACVAANGGYSSIYSNSVHLQICILISSPTNQLFSEPPRGYTGIKDSARKAEKCGIVFVET